MKIIFLSTRNELDNELDNELRYELDNKLRYELWNNTIKFT